MSEVPHSIPRRWREQRGRLRFLGVRVGDKVSLTKNGPWYPLDGNGHKNENSLSLPEMKLEVKAPPNGKNGNEPVSIDLQVEETVPAT